MALPELRHLCRVLTTTPPSRLLLLAPTLTDYVVRCHDVLSTVDVSASTPSSSSSSSPSSSSGTADHALVLKYRTIITALLTGRSSQGRLVGVVLAKATLDVGGWAMWRHAEPWIKAMVTMISRNDPLAVRELAIVTLAKAYALLQPYQTLVREIVTPTLASFATACLRLVSTTSTVVATSVQHDVGDRPRIPWSAVETIVEAFQRLLPLFPTTLRPFQAQILAHLVVPYVAPAPSGPLTSVHCLPESLSMAARRLYVALHHTAPKTNGPADDWLRTVDRTVAEFHTTADQVFRGVQEAWQPLADYTPTGQAIDYAVPPCGGSTQASNSNGNKNNNNNNNNSEHEMFPVWSGTKAGCRRLTGLLRLLAETMRSPTRGPVAVPVTKMLDTTLRAAALSRSSRRQSWEEAVEVSLSVGREEREELFVSLPEVHVAAVELMNVLVRRLGLNALAWTTDILDASLRIYTSHLSYAPIRHATYDLLVPLLELCGPSMPKAVVSLLDSVLGASCRDLQEDYGFFHPLASQTTATATSQGGSSGLTIKKKESAANADLFLMKKGDDDDANNTALRLPMQRLPRHHIHAAQRLISHALTYLPQQQHLKPSVRGLLDQTAILTGHKEAMLASILNPFRDDRGHPFPTIFPYLAQRFPWDQETEILRTTMRQVTYVGEDGRNVQADASFYAQLDPVEVEPTMDSQDGSLTAGENEGQPATTQHQGISSQAAASPFGHGQSAEKKVTSLFPTPAKRKLTAQAAQDHPEEDDVPVKKLREVRVQSASEDMPTDSKTLEAEMLAETVTVGTDEATVREVTRTVTASTSSVPPARSVQTSAVSAALSEDSDSDSDGAQLHMELSDDEMED